MRQLYLHIGTEKTGTTSIQSFLDVNKTVLSKHGFHVLECGGRENHRAIPSYCMADNHYDDFFLNQQIDNLEKKQQFREKIYQAFVEEMESLDNDIHSVIISSEHFHSRLKNIETVETFKHLIANYFSEIKIICYLREQSSLVSSLYSTAIKAGENVNFSSFVQRCSENNPYYNYHLFLGMWSAVFSQDSLDVRVFSKEAFYNHDLLDDFCSAIDNKLLSFADKQIEIENQSLSTFGLLLGRAVNSIFPKYNDNGVTNQKRRNAIKQISQEFSGHPHLMSAGQYQKIQATYQESNNSVAKKYFKNCEKLFTPKPKTGAETLISDEQVSVLIDIISATPAEPVIVGNNVNLFRDAAILLEGVDINKAYKLMKLAQQGRPNGKLIRSKIKEYEGRM